MTQCYGFAVPNYSKGSGTVLWERTRAYDLVDDILWISEGGGAIGRQ